MSDRKYNCPNCGAPIGYTELCVYCGTRLHWIPTTNITFTPTRYERKKLVARAEVNEEDLRSGQLEEKTVLRHLRDQLAERIPEVWEVYTMDDPLEFRKIYEARLLCYGKD